jgi:hypothetical protein
VARNRLRQSGETTVVDGALIAASPSLGVPLLGLQRAQNTADLRSL